MSTPANEQWRKRRRRGRLTLTVALLVSGIWLGAGWWQFGMRLGPFGIAAWDGHTSLWWTDAPKTKTFFIHRYNRVRPKWDLYMHSSDFGAMPSNINLVLADLYSINNGGRYAGVRAVLWFPALALWAMGAAMLRAARRARLRTGGVCAACGYSRSGLADDAVCPECGKPAAPL